MAASGVLLLACGSSIDVLGPGGAGGSGAASSSSGTGAGITTSSGTGGTTSTSSGTGGVTSTSSGTTSSGTTSSSSSGDWPPPSEWCSDCAEQAIAGPCAGAWDGCVDNFACDQLLKCHTDCEWTAECNEACDDIIPSAVPLFTNMIHCVACDVCAYACGGSSLMAYCG